MIKNFTRFGFAALAASICLGAYAQQQLPNAGFEEDWGDCIPWTSTNNGTKKGSTPKPWTISHVIGISGLGKTEVGGQTEGYDSDYAVCLRNTANSFSSSQIVPGYVTLGTTWSTSGTSGFTPINKDGGTFGGIEFTDRPTAISFRYKRTLASSESTEQATVVAYLWKGTYTQKNVPGNIVMGDGTTTVDMVDRDRNILDMETTLGGEVTKTDDAECIAKINYAITGTADEWTECTIPFEYLSESTPEKINVIFCAGDYFSTSPVKNNELYIDDVKLIYAQEEDPAEVDKYPGTLTIDMGDGTITDEPVAATVEIQYTGDNQCTISLPDFTLALDSDSEPINLGDIVVYNVTVTPGSTEAKYEGEVKGLLLYNEMITADATVSGTIDNKGNAHFTINVLWTNANMPIYVEFNGTGKPGYGTSGVSAIDTDEADAVAEYYTIGGVRVNAGNLTPGIYIVRKGSNVSKIVVR